MKGVLQMSHDDHANQPADPSEIMRRIDSYFASTPPAEVVDRLQALMPTDCDVAAEDASLSQMAGELAWGLRDGSDFVAFDAISGRAIVLFERLKESLTFLAGNVDSEPVYLSSAVRHMLVARRDDVKPTLKKLVSSSWYKNTREEMESLIAEHGAPSREKVGKYRSEFSALASLLAEAAL
jgi:hypothetical protein